MKKKECLFLFLIPGIVFLGGMSSIDSIFAETLNGLPIATCTIPIAGVWVVNYSCFIPTDKEAPAGIWIQKNSVLVIPTGRTLVIDDSVHNILIDSGSGLLIRTDGLLISKLIAVDFDSDGIFDKFDNCPVNANPGQEDNDNDGKGNVCDQTPNGSGFIIVNKTVVGGTSGPDDFLLTVDGNAVFDEVAVEVNPGIYVVAETNLPGYTAGPFGGDCSAGGSVTVALGETKTCTITNTYQTFIVVNKTVINNNGGTKVADDFLLKVNGNAVLDEVPFAVNPGTHTVTETNLPGYTAGPFGGDCSAGGSVTVALGETKTCTITNDDQQAFIVVNKIVDQKTHGTANPDDFSLKVNGNAVLDEVAFPVLPGTHTVTETNLPGYTAGPFGGDCSAGGSVTVALGETKTCTITNTYQQAFIVVNKTVINDNGGSAVPNDFSLKVNGNAVLDEVAFPVLPGTHTVTETNLPGYTAGPFGGDCSAGGSVTIALGETKTCTITNDDQQAFIVVNKTVINNNGGTKVADDFLLKVNGNAVLDEVPFAVNPGTHTVTETNLPGYTAGPFGGDCSAGGSVTVALGETKTCTITNDDQQAVIVVNKIVVNNNGGTKTQSEFALKVDGSPAVNGVGKAVSPGTHIVSETAVPGYVGTIGGDCSAGGSVTIALGETKTCTITNDDQQAFIVVNKTVINDNGGSAVPNDFSLKVNGNAVLDEVPFAVNPGTHTVTETNLPGYTAGPFGGDCSAGGSVTIALGETKTCTITNNDQQPTITVEKDVVGGGPLGPDNFTLKIDATTVTRGVAFAINAGTYTVNEDPESDYTPSFTGDCNPSGVITVAIGENKTCTITNTYSPP